MFIRVATIDGTIHTGDATPEDEIQAYLDEHNGYVGTGDWENKQILTVEDFIELMDDTINSDDDNELSNSKINLQIGGNKRSIKTKGIVWWEIVRD